MHSPRIDNNLPAESTGTATGNLSVLVYPKTGYLKLYYLRRITAERLSSRSSSKVESFYVAYSICMANNFIKSPYTSCIF